MARIRADYVFGTTTAALTASDTTLSSAELTRLPAVASPDIAAVTLHNEATGAYEIVHVTAHAAAATTATILRAREGTTAAAWASGASWTHGLTVADLNEVSGVGNTAQLCIVVDDLHTSGYYTAMPIIERYNGKLNFAAVADYIGTAGKMTSAQLTDAKNRGHEIMCHTKTHTDMTTLNTTTRAAEWDTAKTTIEGYVGAGSCKNFVYPFSAHSSVTDAEGYLRYSHLFAGASDTYQVAGRARAGLVLGRWSWSDSNHAATLQLVRDAFAAGQRLTIYTHQVDGTNLSNSVTVAEFKELVQLASSLGMPMVRCQDAFPDEQLVTDAGFEVSTLTTNWTITQSGSGTRVADSFATTTAAGLPGSRVLRLSGTDQFDVIYVTSKPILIGGDGGKNFTLSGRVNLTTKTAGTGGADIRFREYDAAGTQLADNAATQVTAVTSGWQSISVSATLNSATAYVLVLARLVNLAGTIYFDHLEFAPTSEGVHG